MMIIRTSHLLLLGALSAPTMARMERLLMLRAAVNSTSPTPLSSSTSLNGDSAADNSTLPRVCTPTQCLQGINSLSAGVRITSHINSTVSRSTTLLPGTYTANSPSTANTSLLTFSSSSSSFTPSSGFTTSGTLGSTFTVSLQPGVVAYPTAMFEGTPVYVPIPTSDSANSSTSASGSINSLLFSDNLFAIVQVGGGQQVVVWEGVADVSQWGGVGSPPNDVKLEQVQSTTCTTPCASGGVCVANGKCACATGWNGTRCDSCALGRFGPTCLPCPTGCTNCDQGVTGTGRCLDTAASNVILPSICNCINGICASNSSSATCSCSAGWSTAANGTQCGACATGYYQTATGDCLACHSSCASCSSPSGTCLSCRSGLQPDSTDATRCVTATSTSSNGTFITCPARTFYDSASQTCIECNPLCDTCWSTGTGGCLTCRTPNGLLNGQCVAINTKTGECDSSGVEGNRTNYGGNAGWVFDNSKGECDALPAKCTTGGIDNFSAASLRSALTCSACVPGSFLSQGICVGICPNGTTVSNNGTTCVACDPTCSTCTDPSTSSCLTCSNPTQVVLNGTCVSSCPAGFYTAQNATCIACHPDCATCGTSFDNCLSCPSNRPVLNSGRCLLTCTSSQYFDTSSSSCQPCSSSCATCAGAGTNDCLSCSGTTSILQAGSCVASDNCSTIAGFGVCLKQLVVTSLPSSSSSSSSSSKFPWYYILLIILLALASLGGGGWWLRKKDKQRRQRHTERFGRNIGQHEVHLKLQQLDPVVAYPSIPKVEDEPDPVLMDQVPLTPRRFKFASAPQNHDWGVDEGTLRNPRETTSEFGADRHKRWSISTFRGTNSPPRPAHTTIPLRPQETGASDYSQRSADTSASGKRIEWGDRNPFKFR